MGMRFAGLLCATLCLPLGQTAHAALRPAVVELFTSEGCSSCPPAERLLGELAQRPDVLALAFHVRYWDSLGWPDRFGLALADSRQDQYARTLRLPGVFTPQVVIDGQQSFVGSDQHSITAALQEPRQGVEILLDGNAQQLAVTVTQSATKTTGQVLLLALLAPVETAIGRGENAGRTVREIGVVSEGMLLGEWNGAEQRFLIARSALPRNADALAVIVQRQNQGAVLAARRFALP